jgi:hypothetical protein
LKNIDKHAFEAKDTRKKVLKNLGKYFCFKNRFFFLTFLGEFITKACLKTHDLLQEKMFPSPKD